MDEANHNLQLQRKRRYFSGQSLDPGLVTHYYKSFGNVQTVLDIGCGLGCMGRLKPDPAIEVYGLDIDEKAITKAKEYEIAQVWDLESGHLPFDDDYFDAVLAKDILEHLQRPWVLLEEIYRVLRSDGIIIASVPVAKPKAVWNDYTHFRGFTPKALRMMFEDYGFEVFRINRMGGIPLVGRLHLVRWIPLILKFPPFNYFFGSSFEIKARKPKDKE